MENLDNIRNFAIVAHVDHGKSTLADRLLEITDTVQKRDMQSQLLDSNPIERERGITIKLAPVRMKYRLKKSDYLELGISNLEFADSEYILNLIDTPGHVDFSYEVSRSLAACEGVILLVDATQGVQAQTLAHYQQAQKLGLTIIPVVNKIDITTADVPGVIKQMQDVFDFSPSDILLVSGKTGAGVAELLLHVIKKVPPPVTSHSQTRALVFNSNFDSHLGVVAWVRVMDGRISVRDSLHLLGTGADTHAVEVGFFTPAKKSADYLSAGEVGYVVTGLKAVSDLQVGDTLATADWQRVVPLAGYQPINPVVFVSFYLVDGSEINTLRDALGKLKLQDSALQFAPEFSPALGNGFRVGLLGLLHADIVQERLEREFGLSLIAAAPSVSYEIVLMDGTSKFISKAMDMPDPSLLRAVREPIINLSILVPESYVGSVIQLCQDHRGTMINMEYLGQLVHLSYTLPLAELIHQFYDQLKSVSQGFATLDYELAGYQSSDLVKLDILIAGEKVDALSQIIPRIRAPYIGRDLTENLKNIIPRQQFEISIQAAIGGHIIARTDLKAFRKDVLAKMSGGDQTRKDKLLKKQKKGKSRMKRVGKIDLPQEAFLSILKAN